jgi:lysophospholipase L1-like esterase
MFRVSCKVILVAMALTASPFVHAAAAPPIALGSSETIVFFGDSITQQNLYTAYIETFLISRFPEKQLLFWNAGIGGNKVDDALSRFDRDVAPLKPTIVIVNFGMNDGKYVPPDPEIRAHYVQGLKELVAKISAVGARPILCTPPAANKFHAQFLEPYNETLAGLAQAVKQLGTELKVPVIDLFTPFRPVAEQAAPDPMLIPDGVHPNDAGHVLLAAPALSRFGAPGPLGQVAINGQTVKGNPLISISAVSSKPHALSFQMKLSHLPFFIPAPAQSVAKSAGLQKSLNAFDLQIKNWSGNKTLRLLVNEKEVAVIAKEDRAQIDLAEINEAPWNKAAATLWKEAQSRFDRQSNSWRAMGIDVSDFSKTLDSTMMLREALHVWSKEAGLAMRTLVAPTSYNVQLEETDEVVVHSLELSQKYAFDLSAADFETKHPPETSPDTVQWRTESVVDRALDLEKALDHPKKSVVYARLVLQSSKAGEIDLQMGSNDGLSVFLNGSRVLAHNVSRGLKLGDEALVAKLNPGKNVLMFRVTQHELRHGLIVKIRALGDLLVNQVVPKP